ncbi:S-layer homology domain-containing protein [Paenibacillus radicis (ex Xue et al. 2023)]|uniref:S-layer homology domain-containing protein n=1 Tax=Paenibacillus radicis (ex Xue et al. 2023) TaxID=2972489 RepID=A0ABT1YI94_9BACL|nr:S-layer homology domain-containing protein [Paenibacillus radicis (ex Xue et al. 2023)]MCR8632450.1 S-layer homology domain-containing protein [Paenibacillus radicis (ex Xue et al. 2023)]
MLNMGILKASTKVFAIIISFCLIFSSFSVAFASDDAKDINGHWAESQLKAWTAKGYIQGYADGTVKPDNSITRAEFMTIVNRSFGFKDKEEVKAIDVDPNGWEYEQVAIALKSGYISGYEDGTMKPGKKISRQEAAVIIAALLKLDTAKGGDLNKFKDATKLPSWSKGAIGAAVAIGVFNGYEDGTLRFENSITRAEAIVILDRAAGGGVVASYDKAGTYGPESGNQKLEGNVVINTGGVILQNVTIIGNLTLGEGIGDGDVSLNNVKVSGDTFVNGGGTNSIHFKDSVLVTIIVNRKTGEVRILAEGTTTVKQVTVQTGAKIDNTKAVNGGFSNVKLEDRLPSGSNVSLLGNFENVSIAAKAIKVEVPSGEIKNLNVEEKAGDSQLNLGKEAKVLDLVLKAILKVLGEGKVGKATIEKGAEGSTFATLPGSTTGSGVTGGGGGGGGGGSSSKGNTTTPAVNQAAAPTADPAAGVIDEGSKVKLSSATVGAAVYFTKDGSDPTTASIAYDSHGPITVSSAVTIKAIAVKTGMTNSAISTFAYTTSAADTTAPLGGTVSAFAIHTTGFTLSWSGFTDNKAVTGYKVYEIGNLLNGSVTGTTYVVTGLSPNTNYDGKFSVRAYDAAGNVSSAVYLAAVTTASSDGTGPVTGKYAIASFKATDANVLSLELNSALTEEAAANLKVELKKDGNVITSGYIMRWDDKKTVATLTFDSKFQESKYDVSISGLSNIDATNKTASTTTSVERITNIEFLTASDTIPLTIDRRGFQIIETKLRIDFKATNQYGTIAKLNSNSFDIVVNGGMFSRVPNEQAIHLIEDQETQRNDKISITIGHVDSKVQVNKTFTVGDYSIVSKVEVGDLINASGKKMVDIEALSANNYLQVKAYDQYGFLVEDKRTLNREVIVYFSDFGLETGSGVGNLPEDPFVDEVVGGATTNIQIRSVNNANKEFTITFYSRGGNTTTKAVRVFAPGIPTTVDFGPYDYILAENDMATGDDDMDRKLYIPLILKNSKGELLSADDIVNVFSNGDRDSKLKFTSSDGINLIRGAEIATTGPFKGYIVISWVARKGPQFVTVSLGDYKTVTSTLNISVREARKPDSIKISTIPKKYILGGTETEVKFKVYDQYDEELKYVNDMDATYKVKLTYSGKSIAAPAVGVAAEEVYFASKEKVALTNATPYTNLYNNRAIILSTVIGAPETSHEFTLVRDVGSVDRPWKNFFDKSFKFYSTNNSPEGTWTLKATLIRYPNISPSNPFEISSISTSIERIDPNKSENKLTYEVYLDKGVNNNTILATNDFYDVNNKSGSNATGATFVYNNYRKVAKEVKLRAKKASGEEVAIASGVYTGSNSNTITFVASNNPLVVNIPDTGTPNGKNFIVGLDAGSAKVNVVYRNAKGEQEVKTIDVTSKNEAPAVAKIVLGRTFKTVNAADINGTYLWDRALAEKITVTDQFGDEIISELNPADRNEEGNIPDQFLVKVNGAGQQTNDLLGLKFSISDIIGWGDVSKSVSIDNNGKITYNGGSVYAFTVNVLAPNGVTASFYLTVIRYI